MSDFDRELYGYRSIETVFGDSLARVAARELGDATRWAELAWINDLIPPYITDEPDFASDKVLLSGGTLLVPAAKTTVSVSTNPDEVFGADCLLADGLLGADENGDFAVVAGRANLKQQIVHRIETNKGELLFHPEYGCSIRRLLGKVTGPTAALLGAKYVESALKSDFRVDHVTRAIATVQGDSIRIEAEVVPISGRSIDISVG